MSSSLGATRPALPQVKNVIAIRQRTKCDEWMDGWMRRRLIEIRGQKTSMGFASGIHLMYEERLIVCWVTPKARHMKQMTQKIICILPRSTRIFEAEPICPFSARMSSVKFSLVPFPPLSPLARPRLPILNSVFRFSFSSMTYLEGKW